MPAAFKRTVRAAHFVAPAYKSGHMSLNGFVKNVEMQNRELKAWIDGKDASSKQLQS